jgi:hypothetical protein
MNVIGDTIEILRGTNATAAQLARLREVLQNAQQKKPPREEVSASVERAGFGALAKQLLIPKTDGAFWTLVGVVIAGIALLEQRPTTVYEDRSVHQTLLQVAPAASAPAANPADAQSDKHAPAAKVARNAPCPCGSGKKYKQCCGAIR